MTTLVENFAADTGQFSTFGSNGLPTGTFSITGGQGLSTVPPPGLSAVTSVENSWTVSTPNFFISSTVGVPTWQWPFPGAFCNYGVGIAKDTLNYLVMEVGTTASGTTYNCDILLLVGGSQHNLAVTNNQPTTALPDAVGLGLQNNIASLWLSFGGAWQAAPVATADVSSFIDFTTPGALTGWYPAIHLDAQGQAAAVTFATKLFRYVAPFVAPTTNVTVPNVVGETKAQAEADLIAAELAVGTEASVFSNTVPAGNVISQAPIGGTVVNFGSAVNLTLSAGASTVSAYGKFVGSAVYPPTLLINATGIKPRVWMPRENTTVKS